MINIRSHIRDYSVHFGDVEDFLSGIKEKYPHRCYIVDANVWRLYKEGLLQAIKDEEIVVLPVDEEKKCLRSVTKIYDRLISSSAKRNLAMISIGGGITQDIAGFAASTLYRGIHWIFIPTTLLAQADSCIGSKTSLNYKSFKNLIGTFYPPAEVLIDARFIATQKDIDFHSGVGEIVKLYIIGGQASVQKAVELLPGLLSKEQGALSTCIHNSLLIKQSYIEEDEFDLGRRNLLNYGHCFGHALESVSDFKIPHGQAVVLGMLLANILARRRGILSEALDSFIRKELLLPSLAIIPQEGLFKPEPVIMGMKKDKKRTGEKLAVIMLADDYNLIKATDVAVAEVSEALDALKEILFTHSSKSELIKEEKK